MMDRHAITMGRFLRHCRRTEHMPRSLYWEIAHGLMETLCDVLWPGCECQSFMGHPQLSKIKWKKAKSQIDRTDRIVSKLLNGYQISLLRPPYGSISKTMRKKVEKPMILWSLDTEDWKSRNAKKVFNRVKKEVKDGDIILMHDIHPETAEAVKKIVPWLSEQGYDMLTVTELMARKGKTMEGGKAYLDAN